MGCTSAQIEEESIKIIRLDYRQVNMYIDRIPLVAIQKLKDKFDSYSNDQAELPLQQFRILYAPYLKDTSQHNPAFSDRLYLFYNDLNIKGLKFRNFITKYATLNYCEQSVFFDILFFLAGRYLLEESPLTIEDFDKFLQTNKEFFAFKVEATTTPAITCEQFKKRLKQAGFLTQDYRKRFLLMEKQDLPFQAIGRGLIDMDINDFEIGQEYFILSSSWFERWSYYYQGTDDQQSLSKIKSTKLLKKKSFAMHRKKSHGKAVSARDLSMDGANLIIERPTLITFENIQGQFFGELKDNIRIHYECKIVSKELWDLFKKTMAPEYEIKRVANTISSLDLYPKNIYFLQTDQNGQIMPKSLKNILIPIKSTLQDIDKSEDNQEQKQKYYYFTKELGDNIWSEESPSQMLGKCSASGRFFVVKTPSKIGFIDKYFRKKKQEGNITYGDKVYSYFAFNRKIIPAFIMNMPTKKSAIIHYEGFNYRYEIQVPLDSLSIESDSIEESIKDPSKSVKTATENFSFKGIRNIGNTCFINTIVQCLIATPVMGTYLNESNFNREKQPLLYEFSLLAKDLLMNKKVSPVELKKTIDVNLQMFSGNNQHDAQQFLSLLLDKFSQQIMPPNKSKSNNDIKPAESETIVDHLFSGIIQSKITCKDCGHQKQIDERALIVSLPIPQPQFNVYSIYCFPVYEKKIRRVILRLHRTCRLKDYVKGFQDRLGVNCEDYIFVEVQSGLTKKIREDFYNTHKENPLLSQMGFTSSVEIHAFEKIRDRDLRQIKDENRSNHKGKHSKYFDFYNVDQNKWIYARLVDLKQKKITLELMDQDSLSLMKLKEYPENDIKPLGQQIQQKIFKKIINRRINSALQKMQPFGFHYMISYYKEITFKQLKNLIQIVMKNFIEPGNKHVPYQVKINQANKGKCIFCEKVQGKVMEKKGKQKQSQQRHQQCCVPTEEQMNTPLIWIARQKIYSVFVDWDDLDAYCTSFASVAEIDTLSSAAQNAQKEDKINVEECLNLLQQPQFVEIQCDKCKYKEAKKLQLVKEAPNILVLHLKQFRYTADHMLIKMDVNIKWIEYLDISKYCISQSGCLYQLFAYVCHTGNSSSGHYTSVVKRKHLFQNKKVWVSFDDDVTNIMEGEQTNIDSAYLLFFKKVDMPNSSYVNFNVMKELDSMALSKQLSKELSK